MLDLLTPPVDPSEHLSVGVIWNYWPIYYLVPFNIRLVLNLLVWPVDLLFAWTYWIWNFVPSMFDLAAFLMMLPIILMILTIIMVPIAAIVIAFGAAGYAIVYLSGSTSTS